MEKVAACKPVSRTTSVHRASTAPPLWGGVIALQRTASAPVLPIPSAYKEKLARRRCADRPYANTTASVRSMATVTKGISVSKGRTAPVFVRNPAAEALRILLALREALATMDNAPLGRAATNSAETRFVWRPAEEEEPAPTAAAASAWEGSPSVCVRGTATAKVDRPATSLCSASLAGEPALLQAVTLNASPDSPAKR